MKIRLATLCRFHRKIDARAQNVYHSTYAGRIRTATAMRPSNSRFPSGIIIFLPFDLLNFLSLTFATLYSLHPSAPLPLSISPSRALSVADGTTRRLHISFTRRECRAGQREHDCRHTIRLMLSLLWHDRKYDWVWVCGAPLPIGVIFAIVIVHNFTSGNISAHKKRDGNNIHFCHQTKLGCLPIVIVWCLCNSSRRFASAEWYNIVEAENGDFIFTGEPIKNKLIDWSAFSFCVARLLPGQCSLWRELKEVHFPFFNFFLLSSTNWDSIIS